MSRSYDPARPLAPSNLPEYLTTAQAAEVLNVAESTLRRWRSMSTPGAPQAIRTPTGSVRYPRHQVLAWLGMEAA